MESIDYYKNDEWGYKIINDYLRDGDDENINVNDKVEKHIENIDSLIVNSVESKTTLKLYRGFRSFFDIDITSFVNLGYSSCSTNLNIALRFSGIDHYVLVFDLPSDVLFYKYDDKNSWLAEDEYLLQRGLTFTIVERQQNIFHCKIKK